MRQRNAHFVNPNESKDKVVINSLNRLIFYYRFAVMVACERESLKLTCDLIDETPGENPEKTKTDDKTKS